MAKFYNELESAHNLFIGNQKLFFVSTAPSAEGTINLSPKGYECLKLIDANNLVFADYYGSGNETANHLSVNPNITFMWCSFDEAPLILRIYGQGMVIGKTETAFEELMEEHFSEFTVPEIRQIFKVRIEKVQTSCGWGVPFMAFVAERPRLRDSCKK